MTQFLKTSILVVGILFPLLGCKQENTAVISKQSLTEFRRNPAPSEITLASVGISSILNSKSTDSGDKIRHF
ncbi:MAG: hypothetical protein FJ112_01710 [Deltaproteobacteria bacterium]|nr:hypothetical protein [Deltaproteobacteria bacterium]